MTSTLRHLREQAGLTQAALAARAKVSRQLVGAVEAGRHLPRVDAAMAIAAALGVEVSDLFGMPPPPVDVLTGAPPMDAQAVRASQVGSQPVTAPARTGGEGWDVADAYVSGGRIRRFSSRPPGLVVAGCEPALETLERSLREEGWSALAVSASSAAARAALWAGRAHAAVVHGPESEDHPDGASGQVVRFGLCRWQVGLAGAPEAGEGWWREALSGRSPVVQREEGAAVQAAFERSLPPGVRPPGPRARGHLEAARHASLGGMAAVTIEPAALAAATRFHPLEVHRTELWVDRQWLEERGVVQALEILSSRGFRRRLASIGGYDLADCGVRLP